MAKNCIVLFGNRMALAWIQVNKPKTIEGDIAQSGFCSRCDVKYLSNEPLATCTKCGARLQDSAAASAS